MNQDTFWTKPMYEKGGLDHLGVQAPNKALYAELLPGITNVTERLRYYSFYPWFFHTFHTCERFALDDTQVITFLRRAECLLTLIAHRHNHTGNGPAPSQHIKAMVGSNTLGPALNALDSDHTLRLSHFADPKAEKSYFQNLKGGLGQYYFSTLASYGFFEGDLKKLKCVVSNISPLAKSFASDESSELFFQTLNKDEFDLNRLDQLASFCFCQLRQSASEQKQLTNLLFATTASSAKSFAGYRPASLSLILHWIDGATKVENPNLASLAFRAQCYANATQDQQPWNLPSSLERIREGWALYEQSELLAMAMQGLFQFALSAIDSVSSEGVRFSNSGQFAEWLFTQEIWQELYEDIDQKSFSLILEEEEPTLPGLLEWQAKNHECQLAIELTSNLELEQLLETALDLLLAIAIRAKQNNSTNLPADSQFSLEDRRSYSLSLGNFLKLVFVDWAAMTFQQVVKELLTRWTLDCHLQVALIKMAQYGQDTFRLKPTEFGLLVDVDRIPTPVFTNPRFEPSRQFLVDLGLIETNSDQMIGISLAAEQILSKWRNE
ncbi:MAG: hypothetical protein RRB13_09410 [bacterium]|nr:hypothetical protein [bacterium]